MRRASEREIGTSGSRQPIPLLLFFHHFNCQLRLSAATAAAGLCFNGSFNIAHLTSHEHDVFNTMIISKIGLTSITLDLVLGWKKKFSVGPSRNSFNQNKTPNKI